MLSPPSGNRRPENRTSRVIVTVRKAPAANSRDRKNRRREGTDAPFAMGSLRPDPRVDKSVGDVDREIDENDEESEHRDGSLQHRIIAGRDRVEGERPHAGPV